MTNKAKQVVFETAYEAVSVVGKKIRTSQSYWKWICDVKHDEVEGQINLVLLTLEDADEVYQKSDDKDVHLYYKKINRHFVCVVTRHLNGDGFIVTAYLTSKRKRKGVHIYAKRTNKNKD